MKDEFRSRRDEDVSALTPTLTPVGFCIVLQKMAGARRLCQFRRFQFESFQ